MLISNSVTKSNTLIEAGYRLSLTEMQIILYGISLVNPLSENFPLEYKIDIKRFAELFGRDHGDIYDEVKTAVLSKFWERDFSYQDEKGNTVTNRWLTQIKHQDKQGFIQIKFSEDVQPYLHQLSGNFTTYYLEHIANFKSIYSVRLYELAIMELKKSKKSAYKFTLAIEKIRERLDLTDKYKRFFNFKTRVLDAAKKEINKHSDIKFNYKVIKKNRSNHEIEFMISKKQKANISHQATSQKLNTSIIEEAKKIVLSAGTGWDLYVIEQQFYEHVKKNHAPDNLEGAFLGFVKHKVKQKP